MSHLDHVIVVKKALLAKGITNIEEQQSVLAGAYIRALIAFSKNSDCFSKVGSAANREAPVCDMRESILSKWNEISPIPIHLIETGVKLFLTGIGDPTADIYTESKLSVRFVSRTIISEDLDDRCGKVIKLDGYRALIETLVAEAIQYSKN